MSRTIQIGDSVKISLNNESTIYHIRDIQESYIYISINPTDPLSLIYPNQENQWVVYQAEHIPYQIEFLPEIISEESQIPISFAGPVVNVPIQIDHPINFEYKNHNFVINNYLTKGITSLAYEGIYDNIPVIFLVHGKIDIPESIKQYFPIKYFTFYDEQNNIINVMEKLYPPIYSQKFYDQAINFLNTLKEYNLKHNDLSINNVLMDEKGNFKVIDYSPGSPGTRGYSSNDVESLSIVLFELKNQERLKEINSNLHSEIQKLKDKLPPVPEEILIEDEEASPNDYFRWVTSMDYLTEKSYKKISKPNYQAQLYDSIYLFRVYLKIKAANEYLEQDYIPFVELDTPRGYKMGDYIDKNIRFYVKDFYQWFKTIDWDEIDRDLISNIKMI